MEIRFHGRGGQGAVTAARLLAEAAFLEGNYCQAFPFFGAERRGAPVVAFTRINKQPIRTREQVYSPDYVVVLDPTLVEAVDVAAGLKPEGIVILNSKKVPENLEGKKIAVVDATKIAIENLGIPITNTTMLGALARATGVVSLESISKVIEKRFGKLAEKNISAAKRAYEETVIS
ncbi:MAG: pyruvate ferredoxin oxidoreductase subunit gamma [Candidatus Hadarchaeum sp.]|uniref:pyruvate ferredoxin oxidoreductase subunit gamma n=1 Tax=Candidatus Hadarchaeum sp. TaxID=2883567 RepID=UPI003D14D9D1